MTLEEIYNIEVGDKLYVTHKIYKKIFNGPWITTYKPDKFYTVFIVDKTKNYIKLTTGSDVGLNKIFPFKINKSLPYMQHFNLVKKKDYYEIVNIDYFADIYS
jgi:hypothetical protein